MSDWQIVEERLRQAGRRRRLARVLHGVWTGVAWAAAGWLLVLGLYKVFPWPPAVLWWGGLAALGALAAFPLWAWRKNPGLDETARWVDREGRLQERLSTAVELAGKPVAEDWKRLVLGDAAARAEKIDSKMLTPFHLNRAAKWAVALLALGVGLGFVPEYRSPKIAQAHRDAEVIKDAGARLVELTKRSLERKPPAMEAAKQALEQVGDLGEHFAQGALTRADALKDLANLTDKLKQETKQLANTPAFKTLDKAARASSKGGSALSPSAQQQLDNLQKQMNNGAANPDSLEKMRQKLEEARQLAAKMPDKDSKEGKEAKEKLQQALADLSKQSKDAGMSLPTLDEAIAALAESQTDQVVKDLQVAEIEMEKYRDMAQTMQKLQMQMDRLGKDLAEQLQNGQAEAAQSTLQKMAQKLASEKLAPEQMAKMLEELQKAVKPAQEYGEAGKLLQKAADQMHQGDKAGAGQSMAQAAAALDKMMQDMTDAQSMLASMEALQRAQMAIGNGQMWSLTPSKKPGAGGKGNGSKTSGGVGTWADEDSWQYPEFADKWDNSNVNRPDETPRGLKDRGEGELADNLVPTKVKGTMTPGGPMPSITLKGVSIKGASKVQLQEMVGSAQSDAQSALNQDQVPKAYQGAVKDYFDDLKR